MQHSRHKLRTKYVGITRGILCGEAGLSLVESLVATAIVSLTVVAILSGFSTGSMALLKTDQRVTAEYLARSQMEDIKNQIYLPAPASYIMISPLPAGYSISAQAALISGRDTEIQKVTVTVQNNGNDLLTLQGFKLNQP